MLRIVNFQVASKFESEVSTESGSDRVTILASGPSSSATTRSLPLSVLTSPTRVPQTTIGLPGQVRSTSIVIIHAAFSPSLPVAVQLDTRRPLPFFGSLSVKRMPCADELITSRIIEWLLPHRALVPAAPAPKYSLSACANEPCLLSQQEILPAVKCHGL